MKSVYGAVLLAAATVQPAFAEDCAEKFVRLLRASQDAGVPTKKRVVTTIKGGPKMTTENFWISPDHTMTAMLEPAGQWTLIHAGAMYTSADKGETWSKLRDLDPAAAENHIDALAATVENAVCASEKLDGVEYDTVEVDYKMGTGANVTDIHDKYWISREDEFVPHSETTMKTSNFESFVVQSIERAPDLTLPTPE